MPLTSGSNFVWLFLYVYYAPTAIGRGHFAMMVVVYLSVCLFVCPEPDPRSRMEGCSKLTMTPFIDQRAKIEVTTPINALTEKSALFLEWEGLQTSNLVYEWSTMTHITDMRRDHKGQR